MKRVLFVLPSSRVLYSKSKVKVAVSETPSLTFAALAAALQESGHEVRCADLNLTSQPEKVLQQQLEDFSPDYLGINCTTPLYYETQHIASIAKEHNPNIVVVVGGAHPSSLPESTMMDPNIDIGCIGEGDITMTEIVSGNDWASIKGITYSKNGAITANQPREYIKNLDDLPFPAWNIFDIKAYKSSTLSCRNNPVGTIETSRGCPFGCTYCNKSIFGRTFRPKSPARVVDEMEYMLNLGFKEIHINDDGFTTDLNRAKQICDLICQRGLNFPWRLCNGIRVDRVDREFLRKARNAGCYGLAFGVESGDQALLDNIDKGITIEQVRDAFTWAKETGLETTAFFMIGLPGETEQTIQKSINCAISLAPDYAKTSILLPLPGTYLYNSFEQKGYIKSKDWILYNQHNPSGVYDHPNLTWETIHSYYDLFYKRFYLRPDFIWQRFRKHAFSLDLFRDATYMMRTKW